MADDKTQDFQKRVEVEKPRSQEDYSKQDKGQAERAFERSRQIEQRQEGQSRGQEKRLESEQVKKSRPHMMPTPSGPMRSGADRQAHQERSTSDSNAVQENAAKRRAEALEKRQEQQLQNDKGQDRER